MSHLNAKIKRLTSRKGNSMKLCISIDFSKKTRYKKILRLVIKISKCNKFMHPINYFSTQSFSFCTSKQASQIPNNLVIFIYFVP